MEAIAPRRRARPHPLVEHPTDWGRLRVARNLSIRELEARSGVPRITLSFLERGRLVPTAEEAARIVGVLRPLDPS